MKALLMHPDRDFDPKPKLPRHEQDLTRDLALGTLLRAMAGDDPFLFDVARTALLSGFNNDGDTILYRQEVVRDCIENSENSAVVRQLYGLAVEAIEGQRRSYWGYVSRHPSGILSGSVNMLEMLVDILAKLRSVADLHTGRFASSGLTNLFATLRTELSDEYLTSVQSHLRGLKFKRGILLSAQMGTGNAGANYVLRQAQDTGSNWFDRLLRKDPTGLTFHIHEGDEAGARALSEMSDRGINLAANAAAQATEHLVSFFEMLKTELAFYVCCLNLHDRLAPMGAPVCLPRPEVMGARKLRFNGLYDVSLSLSMGRSVVGNSVDADGMSLVIITGANQGGKSSFLRSIGLAQLMMQCGLFVGAESFSGELCTGLFTHYKREEDATMNKGKLDEELSRLSDIVDTIAPNAMLLLNESFAATNEREGSEIAAQVVCAVLEKHIKIFFVTHLYQFAHGFFTRTMDDALFLRAERQADGTRTFRLAPGEPLQTSYGQDIYRTVFRVKAK